MKKVYSLSMALILCFSLFLSGCGSSNNSTDSSQSKDTGTESAQTENKSEETKSDEVVTITYASWADPKVEDQRIAAFEAAHPNINVERDESITWPWNEKLSAAAAAGKMPDVFWVFDIAPGVVNGWLEDLTPYLEKDPEYSADLVYDNIMQTANYYGKQYAMPHGLFAQFMLLNVDMFEKENIPIPSNDWTIEEFQSIAKKLTKYNEHQFGLSGHWGLRDMLISQIDPSLGWKTWDGEKYNFDNPAYAEAINLVNDLVYKDKVTADAYTPEEREKWYGKDVSPWNVSKVGMILDANWAFPGHAKNLDFEYIVKPLPKGEGQRVPLVVDYIGMSKNSKHKEAAFELVKWMSYSKEGWQNRFEVEESVSSMPIIKDQELWDAYLNHEDVPEGMKEIVDMIPGGFVDAHKSVPGYPQVMDMINPYMTQFEEGTAKPEDLADEFQKKAMAINDDAWKQIEAAANK